MWKIIQDWRVSSGDKYKYWSKEDFVCSDLNCSDTNCKDGMKAKVEYGCNEIRFEQGTSLGEGGFSRIFQFPFHQRNAAFKIIPIYFQKENDKNKAMFDAYQEFKIMKTISTKPKDGDDMTGQYWRKYYEDGMEELVVSPLACFYVETISTSKVWMILIMPKLRNDLNEIKREGSLDEDNIKAIMAQLFKIMRYLQGARNIRHQDIKPENILLDYTERNNKITNIKVYSILLT